MPNAAKNLENALLAVAQTVAVNEQALREEREIAETGLANIIGEILDALDAWKAATNAFLPVPGL